MKKIQKLILLKIFWRRYLNKYDIVKRIEAFAPLETQEKWDSSGWIVDYTSKNVEKIYFAAVGPRPPRALPSGPAFYGRPFPALASPCAYHSFMGRPVVPDACFRNYRWSNARHKYRMRGMRRNNHACRIRRNRKGCRKME